MTKRLAMGGMAALAVLLAAVAPATALAQVLSPDEVRGCLCLKRSIDAQRPEVEVQAQFRRDKEAELAEVDRRVHRQRATMDPESMTDYDEMQGLLGRLLRLREGLREVRRAEADAIAALNVRVERYNGECTVRKMLKSTVARIEAELDAGASCPPP